MRWCYDHDVALIPRGGGTGLAAGAVPTDGGIVLEPRAPADRPVARGRVVARPCRGGDQYRRRRPAGARERSAVPARSGRRRAIADRRQHRHQRRRPAHLQVRRHRRLGDWARARDRARRADLGRRPGPQGCGRLRHQVADRRLRGHARGRHRGLAEADAGARIAASGRRLLRERRSGLPGARRGVRLGAACRPRSSISTRAPWPPRRRRFRTPSPAPPRSC